MEIRWKITIGKYNERNAVFIIFLIQRSCPNQQSYFEKIYLALNVQCRFLQWKTYLDMQYLSDIIIYSLSLSILLLNLVLKQQHVFFLSLQLFLKEVWFRLSLVSHGCSTFPHENTGTGPDAIWCLSHAHQHDSYSGTGGGRGCHEGPWLWPAVRKASSSAHRGWLEDCSPLARDWDLASDDVWKSPGSDLLRPAGLGQQARGCASSTAEGMRSFIL